MQSEAMLAERARAEALLVKARRDSGNPELTLIEAEQWWNQRRAAMGLGPSRWPSA